ncbi:MAG TPA: hypothetical protein P5110_07560 [Candidatus Omnitrophota bacterium]|nr:hypothetical protein [Candidatus Omnitrophota bacterium]
MVVDEYALMEQQAKRDAMTRRKQRTDALKKTLTRQGLATKMPAAEEKIAAEESGVESQALSDIAIQRAKTEREDARIKQQQKYQSAESEKGRTFTAEQTKSGQDWQSKFREEGQALEAKTYDVGGYRYNWAQQQNAWQKDQVTFENNLKISNALIEARAKSLMERASAGETIPDSEIVTDADRYAINAGKAAATKISQGWAREDAVREAQNKITKEQQKNASDLQKEHEGGSYVCDAVRDQLGFDDPESDRAALKRFKAYCRERDPRGYSEYMAKAPSYIPGLSTRILRVLKLLLVNKVVKLTKQNRLETAYWIYRITCRVIEFSFRPARLIAREVA